MTEQQQRAERLNENIATIEDLSRRLGRILSERKPVSNEIAMPGTDFFARTGLAYMKDMMTNPGKVMEDQIDYWSKSLQIWSELSKAPSGDDGNRAEHAETDRRFMHHQWHTHPYFAAIRKQYDLNTQKLQKSLEDVDDLKDSDRERLEFVTQQVIDMMCPTNFFPTNPEAIEKALETDGQSLVDGLGNLVRDLERNDGELQVTLADPDAFEVGVDLATTEGRVVHRNRLMELIQYSPTTEEVHAIPLLIVPPWINKYYILDLKPKNSFIKWAVDQGYTVFIISWVNPDESHRDIGMDTYMNEGPLEALGIIQDITRSKEVNTIGYCIGGTLLAMTLAYLAKFATNPVRSATFFTTLLDFDQTGELDLFLSQDFVDGIGSEAENKGFFPSIYMARTFSFLRANDLVYGPAIRSYLLGEKPPAFDLLYWNGDSTNMPARMTREYLEEICLNNALTKGTFRVNGQTLSLRDIRMPIAAVACENDHLVNWAASYRGLKYIGSRSKKFILAESGHVAGVINPPGRKKYGYHTASTFPASPRTWRENARFTKDSWWTCWHEWQSGKSGRKQGPPPLGNEQHKALAVAPGSYVKATAVR